MATDELNSEEAPGIEAAGKKGGGSKKLIIIGVVAVLLLGGGGGALFATGVIGGSSEAEAAAVAEPIRLPTEARPTVPLKEFVVNLADVDKAKYLKLGIELEAANAEVAAVIEPSTPAIRDSIVELLSSKSYAQIRDAKGKARLRQELLVRLNEILGTNGITQVYFTDFIVQ
ncbi:MAG: flagellar basal body-associated FliL family protein [Deltaproteobacteria bacterium]|nr:flagellar basal body-associated FliL family protein [bacterium]MCB9478848.1 flagellar basal body-associated FliL family protein [Deltaproteobacteria bacterium]MCB9488990.1 flagellar basal body-associated FliL family protein [Deltaproteobacteria bacterium]